MANSKSAKKRIHQNEKRRQRNVKVRTEVRTYINGFQKALKEGDVETAETRFRTVESLLDRAVKKGVIPRKRASRRTGRLARRLNEVRNA